MLRFMLPSKDVAPFIDCIICSLLRTVLHHISVHPFRKGIRNADLYPEGNRLKLGAHLVELLNIVASPHQILGLNFTSSHLAILGALLYILNQLLLLIF